MALINLPLHTAETHLLSNLLSDHFALETTLTLTSAPFLRRPRLSVPSARLPHLVSCVRKWYAGVKGTFIDADSLYRGLLNTIQEFVSHGRVPSRVPDRAPNTYARDPVVVNCEQNLATYQARWQRDPADTDARDAMVAVARHLTELRQQTRQKYWGNFLTRVRSTSSLSGI